MNGGPGSDQRGTGYVGRGVENVLTFEDTRRLKFSDESKFLSKVLSGVHWSGGRRTEVGRWRLK